MHKFQQKKFLFICPTKKFRKKKPTLYSYLFSNWFAIDFESHNSFSTLQINNHIIKSLKKKNWNFFKIKLVKKGH
jgi:hypothetical protein